jgi:hypothetical protein
LFAQTLNQLLNTRRFFGFIGHWLCLAIMNGEHIGLPKICFTPPRRREFRRR